MQPDPAALPAAPTAARTPPGINDERPLTLCIVQNGDLREIEVEYDPRTSDSLYNGQPLRQAFPSTAEYAGGTAWFIDNEPVKVLRQVYVKYGMPRVLGIADVVRVDEYQGVPVFAERERPSGRPVVIYVPVRTACEFQPYNEAERNGSLRGG